MAKQAADKNTSDMFGADTPEIPSFETQTVRASTLASQISLAISEILKNPTADESKHRLEREDVARRMSEYLDGEEVSANVLNAYCSQARETHNITLVRFIALMHATNDFRLLKHLAELFDLTVIPRKHEHAVQESILAEQLDDIKGQLEALRRRREQ